MHCAACRAAVDGLTVCCVWLTDIAVSKSEQHGNISLWGDYTNIDSIDLSRISTLILHYCVIITKYFQKKKN